MPLKNVGKLKWCYGATGVQWTIDEFLALAKNGDYYTSSPFPMFESDWYIKMFPNGIHGCDGWVSLYLIRESFCLERKVNFEYTIGLKKQDGSTETVVKSTWTFGEGDDAMSYGTCNFLERSDLHKRRSELLPSGSLTVMLVLRENEGFDSSTRLDQLSDNFADLFISQKNCDVVINVSDSKKISAHKLILSARSPVFAEMLENDSNKGDIDIDKDCHADSFEDFVRYLYSGRVENLSSYACQLYRTAEKYRVKGLQSVCVGFLLNNITLENLRDAVIIAFQYSEEALMEAVQSYFTYNLRAIIRTGNWTSLLEEDRAVANELLLQMACKKE